MQPDVVIRRSPRAVFRKLADGAGAVVLHLDTAAYHGLDEVGAMIWASVPDEGVRFEQLLQGLRSQLRGAPPELDEEIAEFLAGLSQRNLIVLQTPGSVA